MPKERFVPTEEQPVPPRNKYLLYFAFALTAIGAAMALAVTILLFIPGFINLTWQNLFRIPYTYVLIAGLIFVTAGIVLQRVITPPMATKDTEKLRSRLE